MIAKVIAHGNNRDEAIHNLSKAIGDLQVAGFPTNTSFLGQILQLPAFQGAKLDTNFISDNKVHRLMQELFLHTGPTCNIS